MNEIRNPKLEGFEDGLISRHSGESRSPALFEMTGFRHSPE